MEAAAEEGFTGAVVVARGGEALLEKGYGRIERGLEGSLEETR
jgi:hypothetical protein